jgi:hypothetical protein
MRRARRRALSLLCLVSPKTGLSLRATFHRPQSSSSFRGRRFVVHSAIPASRDNGPSSAAHFHFPQETVHRRQRIFSVRSAIPFSPENVPSSLAPFHRMQRIPILRGYRSVLHSAFPSSRENGPSSAAQFRFLQNTFHLRLRISVVRICRCHIRVADSSVRRDKGDGVGYRDEETHEDDKREHPGRCHG